MNCFNCKAPAEHAHHVVPKSIGGIGTVMLCTSCHGLVHDRKFVNHKQLTVAGLKRAKARGVILGRPRIHDAIAIRKLRKEGLSYREISRQTGASTGVVATALRPQMLYERYTKKLNEISPIKNTVTEYINSKLAVSSEKQVAEALVEPLYFGSRYRNGGNNSGGSNSPITEEKKVATN